MLHNISLSLNYNLVRHARAGKKMSDVNCAELPYLEGVSQQFPTQMAANLFIA
jgi:hypothetical protein